MASSSPHPHPSPRYPCIPLARRIELSRAMSLSKGSMTSFTLMELLAPYLGYFMVRGLRVTILLPRPPRIWSLTLSVLRNLRVAGEGSEGPWRDVSPVRTVRGCMVIVTLGLQCASESPGMLISNAESWAPYPRDSESQHPRWVGGSEFWVFNKHLGDP